MPRTPEPELMNQAEQVQAYADADFEKPHGQFIKLLEKRIGPTRTRGRALDLGCGPGDITYRFAEARPGWSIQAVDGASAMIDCAKRDPRALRMSGRIHFLCARLPDWEPTDPTFDLVISNSLLHHLADPFHLWNAIRDFTSPNAEIFIMDLKRPSSQNSVNSLVERYAGDEPAVLKRDFEASLHAAYRTDEVSEQFERVGLDHLTIEEISDRHWIVHGPVSAQGSSRDRP